jgi:hypothetical protein
MYPPHDAEPLEVGSSYDVDPGGLGECLVPEIGKVWNGS